jgi:hypothetical protein
MDTGQLAGAITRFMTAAVCVGLRRAANGHVRPRSPPWPSRPDVTKGNLVYAVRKQSGSEEGQMADNAMRMLYRAAERGTVDGYLTEHPEIITSESTTSLEHDFRRAVDFGDLDAAGLAASGAVLIHLRLGNREAALDMQTRLVRLHSESARTEEEYRTARDSALVLGGRALGEGWSPAVTDAWLIAAYCAAQMSETARSASRLDHLHDALRDTADLAELLAARQVADNPVDQVQRLAALVGQVAQGVFAASWPEERLLTVRMLLRRVARAAERAIPRGISGEIFNDPQRASQLDETLMRLFAAHAD